MGAPPDAIREFNRTLTDLSIAAAVAHIKTDIAELRRAYPADEDFTAALQAVSRRVRTLRIEDGTDLDHE